MVDLLNPAVTDGSIQADERGVFVFNGTAGMEVADLRRVASAGVDSGFSVAMTVRLTRDEAAYLMAKSTLSGSRFYSLFYSRLAQGLRVYYRIVGSSTMRSVTFPVFLNDGRWHRILLTVDDSQQARLLVDETQLGPVALAGVVDDCSGQSLPRDCVLYVGQRASATASSTFPFVGEMTSAKIYLQTVLSAHPPSTLPATGAPTMAPTLSSTSAGPLELDMLAPGNHDSGAPFSSALGAYTFNGIDQGLLVSQPDALALGGAAAGTDFSVSVVFRAVAGSSGYVFAKSTLAGSRFYSLFLSATRGNTAFYYRTADSASLRRVDFAVALNDGRAHQVLMRVTGGVNIELRIRSEGQSPDTSPTTVAAVLAGAVDDCGAAPTTDCRLYVGQRSGPAGFFDGAVYSAVLYPRAALMSSPHALPDTIGGGSLTPTAAPTIAAAVPTASPTAAPTGGGAAPTDLLAPATAVSVPGGAVTAFDGALGTGYTFTGAGGLQLSTHPPSIAAASAFSVALLFQQTAGNTGYLFAKSDASGSLRYYALHSSAENGRLSFYFATSTQSWVWRINANVSDGQLHRVLVAVDQSGRTAAARVDDSFSDTVALPGAVADCGAASPTSCVFMIGQRSDGAGGLGAVRFAGDMLAARFYAGMLLATHPADFDLGSGGGGGGGSGSDARSLDLLAAGNHDRAVQPQAGTGLYVFDGSAGLEVTAAFRSVSRRFSVAATVYVAPGTTGYLFAKADGSGRRFYSLYYSSVSRRLYFYYLAVGATRQAVVVLEGVDLADTDGSGRLRQLLLVVDGVSLRVEVDGVAAGGGVAALAGLVDDCGAPVAGQCLLTVAQRPDDAQDFWRLQGAMGRLVLFYDEALADFPPG